MTLRRTRILAALSAFTGLTIAGMLLHAVVPGTGILALVGLAFLPGIFGLMIMGVRGITWLEYVVYSLALSLGLLMFTGLATNEIGGLLGVLQPLRPATLVPVMSVLLALLAGASWLVGRSRKYTLTVPAFGLSDAAVGIGLTGLPLLAVLGATSVNNGGSSVLVVACYGLIAVTAAAMAWQHKRVKPWMWAWAAFAMSLAILWSNSLRGSYITGHDVQLEYYVYQLTANMGHWSMAAFRDAYNACLSITILPVSLQSLTGVSGLAQYKVVFQIIFAIFAAGVYGLARRYASHAVAFLAAYIFITFPTFLVDMPMLNRQEIAFGFFIALLLALFDRRLPKLQKWVLMVLLTIGMVFSHYSTSFVAAGVFAGTYVLVTPFLYWRSRRQVGPRRAITLAAVATVMLAIVVWTGLYTKTSQNISSTIVTTVMNLPKIFQPKSATGDSSYSVVQYPRPNPQVLVEEYATNNAADSARNVAVHGGFYPDAKTYELEHVTQPTTPLTAAGMWLESHGLRPGLITDLGKGGYAVALQAMIVFGIVWVWIRRRAFAIEREFLLLAPAGIALLGMQVLFPTISYGLFRMLQQDLAFLALPAAIGMLELLRLVKIGSERVRLTVIASILGASLLVISGAIGQLTGGTAPTLPFKNTGFYYDAYYTTRNEVATYNWIKANYQPGNNLNTDEFSRMKLLANTGLTSLDGITPTEITRDATVLLDGTAVTEQRVGLYYRGQLLFYRYPTSFLEVNKNLVYSTSTTKVYK